MASGNSTVSGGGSPCGACKFLRRKCVPDCVFAPYFCSEQGPARFAAIHKVFGASNVSKLLLHVPIPHRCEAVVTIAYEAQARLRDPVYGCVSHIFALQQQVAYLQSQLMQAKAQLAQSLIDSGNKEVPWTAGNSDIAGFSNFTNFPTPMNPVSPQSSLDSVDRNNGGIVNTEDMGQGQFQPFYRKRVPCHGDLGELQDLAFRMMRN